MLRGTTNREHNCTAQGFLTPSRSLPAEVARPALGAVHHSKNLYHLVADSISDQVSCCRNNQLPSSGNSARSSEKRELLESANGFINRVHNAICPGWTTLIQISIQVQQMRFSSLSPLDRQRRAFDFLEALSAASACPTS